MLSAAAVTGDHIRPHAVVETVMHDDTIVLDASPVTSAPRIKRLKTEHSLHSPKASFDHSHDVSWFPTPPAAPSSSNTQTTSLAPVNGTEPHSPDAGHAATNSKPKQRQEGPVLRKIKPPSLRLRLAQGTVPDNQFFRSPQVPARFRKMDIETAPSDGKDFIWWLASQISVLSQTGSVNGFDMGSGFDAMTSVMRPLNVQAPALDDDASVVKEKEREKQRVDNRERKKRWREINSERNKDNDLRCRVTKLAKARFGSQESDAKAAFIDREFETRRAKRAEKEKRNASFRCTLSAFRTGLNTSRDLKNSLRSEFDKKASTRAGLHQMGMQLVELLVDAAGHQLPDSAIQIAQTLRRDIFNGTVESADFVDAIHILSNNNELLRALESGFGDGRESVEPESISDDCEDLFMGNGHSTKDTSPGMGPAAPYGNVSLDKSSDATGNLSLALETLNSMSRTQAPRQSNRAPRRSRATKRGRFGSQSKGKRSRRPAADKSSAASKDYETVSIDYLLRMANGGSISDAGDDDDETVLDPDELVVGDLDFSEATADASLNDIFERVATRIVSERLEIEGFERRDGSSLSFNAEAFHSHAIREQVFKLKTFISDAEISVNTLVPLAQAQALSELYAGLLRYIERERSRPSDGALLNGKLATTANGSLNRPSHRSEEEQRRVSTFGYPPLPGDSFGSPPRKPR